MIESESARVQVPAVPTVQLQVPMQVVVQVVQVLHLLQSLVQLLQKLQAPSLQLRQPTQPVPPKSQGPGEGSQPAQSVQVVVQPQP